MALTYCCGFEAGGLTSEPPYEPPVGSAALPAVTGSGVSLETSIVRSGTGSLKLAPTSGAASFLKLSLDDLGTTIWFRYYLRVTSLPSATRVIVGTSAAGRQNLKLKSDGAIEVCSGSTVRFTSSALLTDGGHWYKIDHKVGAAGQELWVDDVQQGTDASVGETMTIQFGSDDTVAATYTAYVDDLAIDGAARRGAAKVLLAVPVSVGQAGSWTGGAGGAVATSAVDFPCAGTNSETDSTQIESVDASGDNATDECRINLTTYTDLGIAAADTINAVMPFVWHGEDVGTGTKTGSFGMQANPADAYGTFNYGENIGALGAFQTNWKCSLRVTSAPSVTRGNNPVVAVRKTDTGTRVASICGMGMYVDYTPAPTSMPPQPNHIMRLIAAMH